MALSYQYIKIFNYNFCLQLNPATLAWILFLKRTDLHSICTPWDLIKKQIGIVNKFYRSFRLFMSSMHIFISFVLQKYNIHKTDIVAELPVFGHICMHVHKGCKVFNLRKRTVVKLFDSDINKASIVDEIERLQTVSCIGFAPTLVKWNIDERWYEEEYILEYPPSSYKSQKADILLRNINHSILPCLNQLMMFKPTKSINSQDYVSSLIGILKGYDLSRKEHDTDKIAKINNFIDSMWGKIQGKGDSDIYLVFSHGDFCPANLMDTKYGIRVLDWEGAEYRSALFDFYSYFFYLPVCINYPLNNLPPKLHESLTFFTSELSLKDSTLKSNFEVNNHVYRWIFYIEFIRRLIEREITDSNLDIMDYIIRYIDGFNYYELLLATDHQVNETGLSTSQTTN